MANGRSRRTLVALRSDERGAAAAPPTRRSAFDARAVLARRWIAYGARMTDRLPDAAIPAGPALAALDAAESALQAAIAANDPDAIGQRLHEHVVYVGPDGSEFDRDADLGNYRSGTLRIERFAELSRHCFAAGSTGSTIVDVELAGTHAGHAFAARARYSRTWIHEAAHGWRVLAATSGPLGDTA